VRVDLIAASIPIFFAMMGAEILYSRLLKKGFYRFPDSIADLGCGVVQQVTSVFTRFAVVAGYEYLFEHSALTRLSEGSIASWIALFVGVDFFYYWFHRLSHEVNLLWAAHVVHHQSEEYNLAVALRQSVVQGWYSWIFYLPLAVVGFPPPMFYTMLAINTLYQFWIHTRLVPKLGPLEWILNTPSHHRVHHGRNPQYINRNHGGTLIIWDRLFGTFEEEGDEVVYGVTEPIESWNPVWANLHAYRNLWADARSAPSWKDKIEVWFAYPGWKPPTAPEEALEKRSIGLEAPKYDPPITARIGAWVGVNFLAVILATVTLLDLRGKLSNLALAPLAAAIVLSCLGLGALFDGRRWARAFEVGRIAAIAAGVLAIVLARSG
jgi:sterol desaturase/sphingolipid hydroxylase (fatty acid hydroxylase superfamily)